MVGLTVTRAAVAFGGLRAVDDVSLEFAPGVITGLIGPNGSGKSTLVNMVAGQVRSVGGEVWLGDRPLTGLRPDRIVQRGLARTYQIPRVPPELSVAEVIEVPLTYVRRRDGSRLPGLEDAATITRFCGLSQSLRTTCGRLSVPDMRRLEIARALACAPQVLLLDEVMAGLSAHDAGQVVDLVRRIHQAGVTVVVIEHVMRIIASLCHHVVVLNYGRVLATGAPDDVLRRPEVREAYLGREFTL
jgi:branched-chain amino acid transport system ATP-binding protein